jgi:hypothetical protein
MTGNLSQAHQIGVDGAVSGLAIGAVSGATSGYASAKARGMNPWTGEYKHIERTPTINGTEGGAKGFFEGAKYSDKVLHQMNKADDILHGFPKSVDGYATKFGQWSTKVGADGKVYQWLEVPGSYGGKTGVFEYIKGSNRVINHRFFRVIP